MGAFLEALRRLQKIERELTKLQHKEESLQRLVRTHQRQVEKIDADHLAHAANITKCQMDVDGADLAIKSADEAVSKHRQTLNAAKSNREYAAILTAINTEKADIAKIENRMLQLMSDKEQLEEASRAFEKERARLEARAQKSETRLQDFLADTKKERDRLKQDRAEAANALPPSALASFDRVASKHEGEALSEVLKVNTRRDDYVCGGCNMSIPLELVNALRGRDELQLCPSCGRVLYIESF